MKKATLFLLVAGLWGCAKKEMPAASPATNSGETTAPADMNVELLKNAPTSVLANEQVAFVPVDGHHFELAAPQDCGGFEFSQKSAKKLACQITAPGEHEISLNICDDGKEYCKPVRYRLTATASKGFAPEGEKAQLLQPPAHEHAPVPGFLINQTDEAVALAKAEGKLLFVHFFGIWCPPCNMLEEHVYTEKSFLDATSGMVRVMLDADSDLSWAWKARFKIGGYPTVVVATADLEEVDRVVGYRPLAEMNKFAATATAHKGVPISALLTDFDKEAAADAPEEVRLRIGTYHFERREYDDAQTWLAEHSDPKGRKLWIRAQQEIAKRDGDDAKKLELTRRLTMDFPDDIEFSDWVEDLIEAKDPEGEALVPDALANLKNWKTSSALAETGYSIGDVAWSEASLHGAAGDEAAAKASYLEAAEHFAKMAKGSNLAVARGANMSRAYALHKAGANDAAKALYEELSTAYAEEFSFNYNFASVLHELGEFDRASEYVDKAIAHAYGDNWLRALHLKAKVQRGLGKNTDAVATLDGALAQAVVPRSTDVRTHGYIRRLRELRAEIVSPTPETKEK